MSARNPAAQGRLYGGLPRPNVLEPPFGRGLPRVPHHALHEEMREAYHSLPGPMQLPAQLEQHLEAQQSLIEALRVDKERLIADNVTLKRELEDTRKQHAEMDLQMSRLYNKFDRMENELRAMRSELSNVHKCIKDSTATNAEIEGLKAELKQIRVAIEHEKKGSAECFQHDKAMEDKVITIAREMENLQAELINAKNKAQAAVVVGNSGCFKVATGLVENLTDVEPSINKKKRRRKKSKKKPKIKDEILNIDQIEMETWSTENLAEGDVNGKRERTSCDVKMTSHLSCLDVKDAERLSKDASSKRKLLVLDVNGLLGNVVKPQKSHRVVKRPFVDDFLGFCFQNFDVGVWSSRKSHDLDRVVVELFGHLKHKLLFCWDQSICQESRYHTLANPEKPIFFKILRKIWEIDYSNMLWKKGGYDESNTLLLDDSPEKALLNPLHTAIFPKSYQDKDQNDRSLGPGGDLRVYLEGLLRSKNVQEYVKQHQFGQDPIDQNHKAWYYYEPIMKEEMEIYIQRKLISY